MKLRSLVIPVVFAAVAQGTTLQDAAERARAAWLAHDLQALVGQSPSLVLQIPGADPSSALGRAQAVELLRRYLRPADEREVAITMVREVEPEKGLVELDRRFVVTGTTDLRRGTLFLAFRRVGGRWALAELRAAP